MALIKTAAEISIMREGGRILARVINKAGQLTKPGIQTIELNLFIEQQIRAAGATPAFLGFKKYPFASCISLNEEVVHAQPSNRKLARGDVVSIDLGVLYKGFYTDMAITVGLPPLSDIHRRLIKVTKYAMDEGLKMLGPNHAISDYQRRVFSIVESSGLRVVRDLSGHGIGRQLHEKPSISNYFRKRNDFMLRPGMTMAIEPMVTCGGYRLISNPDGWGIKTFDGSYAAHFELTVAIKENGFEILTRS